jgi:hypothetical protein
MTDVSNKQPHQKLTGTKWELLVDSYVVEYPNNFGKMIVPCVWECQAYMPTSDWKYTEKNIGLEFEGIRIIAGIRKGGVRSEYSTLTRCTVSR